MTDLHNKTKINQNIQHCDYTEKFNRTVKF